MRPVLVTLASLALLSAVQNTSAKPAPTIVPPAEDTQLARDILRGLVEINTTHAKGTTAAALAIQKWLTTAGYSDADMTFLAPAEHPNSGNLIVHLRAGKHAAGQKPVLFLGHLDVVEAKPEDWSMDPFKLAEKDGYFYGRGTIDMKDGDAALVESLVRLKREHYAPQRDLIIAFTADEEAGGDANGPAFLLKEHRELLDAALAVNLDGGGGVIANGEHRYFQLGTSEKSYVTFTLATTSPGGHGSLPGADNAIYRLGAALARIEAFKFPVTLTATTRAMFDRLATLQGGSVAADMRSLLSSPPDLSAAERLSKDPWMNAELRTTCVATLISGGHAENALPQRAKATIQCRMLPGDDAEHVKTLLSQAVNDERVSLTLDAEPIISPESPPTRHILDQTAALVQAFWPNALVVPSMATGFSDDRQTRNAGIPSYDISGIWIEEGENRAHGRDERVGVQAFDESVEFTYRLLKSMGDGR